MKDDDPGSGRQPADARCYECWLPRDSFHVSGSPPYGIGPVLELPQRGIAAEAQYATDPTRPVAVIHLCGGGGRTCAAGASLRGDRFVALGFGDAVPALRVLLPPPGPPCMPCSASRDRRTRSHRGATHCAVRSRRTSGRACTPPGGPPSRARFSRWPPGGAGRPSRRFLSRANTAAGSSRLYFLHCFMFGPPATLPPEIFDSKVK